MIEFLSNARTFLERLAEAARQAWGDFQALTGWEQAAIGLLTSVALLPVVWAAATVAFVLPLIRRSLRQHVVSTTITVIAVALASGLTMSVFAIESQTRAAFVGGPLGFDAVLGARGSKLQLVLNAVYHLETSPGNLDWETYEQIAKSPLVELAIPMALGDNFEGYRIVGTTEEIFTRFEYQPGRGYRVHPGGRTFDPHRYEAVAGSFVAQKTGLRVGSRFNPYHGLEYDPYHRHEKEYVVVGVMEPTNTPADRVLFVPIEGVYRMEGHVLRGSGEDYHPHPHEEIPHEHMEISAALLKLKGPQAGARLEHQINKEGRTATLAWPIAAVMGQFFNQLGWVSRVLRMVSYLVIVVAAGTILASIYNTIHERRREFAILRALGARRSTVFATIVLEAASIAGLGGLLGYVVYAAILTAATVLVRAQTGVVLDAFAPHWILWTPAGMLAVGALAGVWPALKAYSTDVATSLVPTS